MPTELIKNLLEAGVHFGHQTRRWNPKMQRFIFGERGGIYIIDLEKTADFLQQAYDQVRAVAAKGGRILFVGTKKQAQDVIEEQANLCEMFYVRNRWMGGMLTNYETVKKSIQKLSDIERMEKDGILAKLAKKEIAVVKKQKERLLRDIGGIRTMGSNPPELIVMVDTKREDIAVKEANKLGIPIVGMVDTNCDPDMIDFPIPANDDAVKAIRFITHFLVQGINEGRKEFAQSQPKKKIEKSTSEPKVEVKQGSANEVKNEETQEPVTAQSKAE